MAILEQIKMLIESHLRAKPEQFLRIAREMPAHEAGQGQVELAGEIQSLVDQGRRAYKVDALVEYILAGAMLAAMLWSYHADSPALLAIGALYFLCDGFLR